MKYKLFEPALVLTVFVLDRLGKFFILKHLFHRSVEVLPFFRLTYVQNTGVAFGMFRDSNNFFIVFSVLLIAALLIFRRKAPGFPAPGTLELSWRHLCSPAAAAFAQRAGLALVLGGALGNLYDRLAYGFVVDFFDLSFFPAVFNVADSAITAGAILLAIGLNTGHETASGGGGTGGGKI